MESLADPPLQRSLALSDNSALVKRKLLHSASAPCSRNESSLHILTDRTTALHAIQNVPASGVSKVGHSARGFLIHFRVSMTVSLHDEESFDESSRTTIGT